MGMNKTVYLGPYLRIKPPQKEVEKKRAATHCGKRCDTAFCPSCGAEVKPIVEREMESAVDMYEIGQSVNERLRDYSDACGHEDGFDYWYPNGTPKKWGLPDAEKCGAHEITTDLIAKAIERFTKEYGEDIATIVEAYKDAGEVRFGMLVWWS